MVLYFGLAVVFDVVLFYHLSCLNHSVTFRASPSSITPLLSLLAPFLVLTLLLLGSLESNEL